MVGRISISQPQFNVSAAKEWKNPTENVVAHDNHRMSLNSQTQLPKPGPHLAVRGLEPRQNSSMSRPFRSLVSRKSQLPTAYKGRLKMMLPLPSLFPTSDECSVLQHFRLSQQETKKHAFSDR